ncbi:type II toxin-antitoxin system RelE/ParE family toxin [Xenorhabdus hominickii]|uniref:type II toxin-antitoxin system RelE/ParE family toxin n=1 Tax=Xenorhabdus hominickii TaxID=351679 RepID=UPI003B8457D9
MNKFYLFYYNSHHANRLDLLLNALDLASDLSLPSFQLHPLTGDRKGIWSVSISGNWRLTFEFNDGDVYILNYEDYH